MARIIKAISCNRTYLAKDKSLVSNFYSDIVDFNDMPMGSIQLVWKDVAGIFDGEVKLYASILHEDDTYFDGGEIDGSAMLIDSMNGNRLWIRHRIGFRYLQVRFLANGITGGSVDILALGKKA